MNRRKLNTKGDREELMTIDEMEYNKTPLEIEKIRKYTSEDDYMKLVVEMFKEMITIIRYNSNALRLDENNYPRRWTRDEAILGGMMVRLTKILMGIIDLTCQRKWEIAYILVRPAIETCVNLKFLLKHKSEELFQEYIKYSLKVEKEYLELVESNVKERETELPIEMRIKKSILQSFSDSGYTPDDIEPKKIKRLWGINIYERFKAIGWENYYLISFLLPSHAVHGNWEDILRNHLEKIPTGYKADSSWTNPRPQPLLALIIIALEVNKDYIIDLLPESNDRKTVLYRIDDLDGRSRNLLNLHEQFLQRR